MAYDDRMFRICNAFVTAIDIRFGPDWWLDLEIDFHQWLIRKANHFGILIAIGGYLQFTYFVQFYPIISGIIFVLSFLLGRFLIMTKMYNLSF
jgi:hypothetical protein